MDDGGRGSVGEEEESRGRTEMDLSRFKGKVRFPFSQSYPRQTLYLEIKDQIYLWTSNPKTLHTPVRAGQCPTDKANVEQSSFIRHISGLVLPELERKSDGSHEN